MLSGRFVSFRIRPFVYKEIKEYSNELGINVDVANYLIWGGFPGRFNNISLDGTNQKCDATIYHQPLILAHLNKGYFYGNKKGYLGVNA